MPVQIKYSQAHLRAQTSKAQTLPPRGHIPRVPLDEILPGLLVRSHVAHLLLVIGLTLMRRPQPHSTLLVPRLAPAWPPIGRARLHPHAMPVGAKLFKPRLAVDGATDRAPKPCPHEILRRCVSDAGNQRFGYVHECGGVLPPPGGMDVIEALRRVVVLHTPSSWRISSHHLPTVWVWQSRTSYVPRGLPCSITPTPIQAMCGFLPA